MAQGVLPFKYEPEKKHNRDDGTAVNAVRPDIG